MRKSFLPNVLYIYFFLSIRRYFNIRGNVGRVLLCADDPCLVDIGGSVDIF